ncbi:hypothetical protein D9756_003770 [Leucocoprinus leucothites]|uniref:Uncharacterized protein n=1 Tax=Leucocoprinus leucothites TaxID=201217 RepID=A0A8H5G0S8_9AGAR|nr:hypothetical protein D9756_003770 [Leucoagaricus leucothites]
MDFVQGLDPFKLVFGGVTLSFLLTLSPSPPYNLAIYLFGTYAQEQNDAVQSLKMFTGLLGISAIFDVIWMVRNHQSGFIRFLTIVLVLLKVAYPFLMPIPTFFSFLLVMRQRGAQFGGLSVGESTTVWSMPGGFTSAGRDGYQNLDDEGYNQPHHPPPRAAPKPPAQAPSNNQSAPGAYESV